MPFGPTSGSSGGRNDAVGGEIVPAISQVVLSLRIDQVAPGLAQRRIGSWGFERSFDRLAERGVEMMLFGCPPHSEWLLGNSAEPVGQNELPRRKLMRILGTSAAHARPRYRAEIGRASWRARVCPYVYN